MKTMRIMMIRSKMTTIIKLSTLTKNIIVRQFLPAYQRDASGCLSFVISINLFRRTAV